MFQFHNIFKPKSAHTGSSQFVTEPPKYTCMHITVWTQILWHDVISIPHLTTMFQTIHVCHYTAMRMCIQSFNFMEIYIKLVTKHTIFGCYQEVWQLLLNQGLSGFEMASCTYVRYGSSFKINKRRKNLIDETPLLFLCKIQPQSSITSPHSQEN